MTICEKTIVFLCTSNKQLENIYIYIFCLFRAAPTAYGGSQVRGWIGAVTAGLCHSHSNAGSKLHLQLIPQLTAMSDP